MAVRKAQYQLTRDIWKPSESLTDIYMTGVINSYASSIAVYTLLILIFRFNLVLHAYGDFLYGVL